MSQGRTTSDTGKEKMQKDPRAFLQLAEEHRRTGRLKEAIAVCLEGLGLHPNLDAARITLGRAYLEDGQFPDARAVLGEVFSRQPEHHLAGKLLAETQRRMGDLEGAAATCRTVLSHYPRDREFEALLAGILAGREQPPAAVSESAPATRTMPPEETADPDLEYTSEDVAIGASTPALPPTRPQPGPVPGVAVSPGSASAHAAKAAPPVAATPSVAAKAASPAAVPAGAAGPTRDDAFQTNTLAELYVRQGLVDRAIEVYRGMLRVDPANERARLRLAELEGKGTAVAAPVAPAVGSVTTPSEAPPRGQVQAPADPRRQAIERLESWLDAITEGSAGSAGSGGGTGA